MARYEVLTPITTIEVTAATVSVGNNGDIVFSSGQIVERAFAAGQWLDVAYIG